MGGKREIRFNLALPEKLGNKLIEFAENSGRSRNGAFIHLAEYYFQSQENGQRLQVATKKSIGLNTMVVSTTILFAVGAVTKNTWVLLISFTMAMATLYMIR